MSASVQLQVVKTIRIPVHYALTERKLRILDRLTARLTYGVWLWMKLIRVHGLTEISRDITLHYRMMKRLTALPGHMAQCCYATATWMWRSYRAQHREWLSRIVDAERRKDGRWLSKLEKREPQKPFTNSLTNKIPTWFDVAVGSIERSKRMKLCRYVARISTLRRGVKLTIPLNPSAYHLNLLAKDTPRSFQLVKRGGWYYVHVKIAYDVPDQPIEAVRGVDLGVRRAMATCGLNPTSHYAEETSPSQRTA